MFRYQAAVQSCICQEINRRKLRAVEAPKDFGSCHLAQTSKVGLDQLRSKGGAMFLGCTSFLSHGLSFSSLTLSTSFQSTLKA